MVLLYAVPFFVLSLSLEWWLVRKDKVEGSYETKDALTSMLMGFGNLMSDIPDCARFPLLLETSCRPPHPVVLDGTCRPSQQRIL